MNTLKTDFLRKGIILREEFNQLLLAALQTETLPFARRLSIIWLERYPGDLEIQYVLARIMANEGEILEARSILEKVCATDPELIEAQELLVKLCSADESHPSIDALACVYAMGRTVYSDFKIPDWSFLFRTAWQAYLANQLVDAQHLIQQVLVQKPQLALAAILHQRITAASDDQIGSKQLSHIYHSRFSKCLNFTLLVADSMMKDSKEIEAMELLQECVTNDTMGLVATRIWGKEHRYRSLWPDHHEIEFGSTIPVEVMSFLGMNTLPEGEIQINVSSARQDAPEHLTFEYQEPKIHVAGSHGQRTSRNQPGSPDGENTLQAVDEIFEKLAKKLKQPDLARSDGRYPVYVIMSLKSRLIQKYGKQTFLVLDTELQNLVSAIRSQMGWAATIIYPDDPVSMVGYGLTAIDPIDPWKIKKALVDLDRFLSKKGEMIGALLIVGGAEIVPFHRLPNPTDDLDDDVESDNPYASMDGNYFVQEWPIGRFPDEATSDAGFLLSQIRYAVAHHLKKEERRTWLQRLAAILEFIRIAKKSDSKSGKGLSSVGYSAAVWQRSSQQVYRTIGNGQKLLTSPPELSGSIQPRKLSSSNVGYFNLHGLEDSAEWYGQRELSDQSTQTDYPIALSPAEIHKNGHAPKVVFSEACYGGHITGKVEDQSIAMKYIGIGTGSFVGSTCVSYGSISTPLIAADLLAYFFWRNIQLCSTSGEAFSKAKLDFVKEMEKRQGFLDGEDQKTLLSFVLFGDPLFSIKEHSAKGKKLIRRISVPTVNIMSDDEDLAAFEGEIPADTLYEVKKIAEKYLPGLEDVKIHISQQQMISDNNDVENQRSGQPRKKSAIQINSRGQMVITVSKVVSVAKKMHYHYLRARVNQDGLIDKIAISR